MATKCCGRSIIIDEILGIGGGDIPPPIPCEEICLTVENVGLLPNPPVGCEFALVTSSSDTAFEFIIARWNEDFQDWEQLAYAGASTDPFVGLETLTYNTVVGWEVIVNGGAPLSSFGEENYSPALTTVNITMKFGTCEYPMTEVVYPLAQDALIFQYNFTILSSPVADPTSLTDWNNYFAGFYSSPFTSIQTDTTTVYLFGGEDVIIPQEMFLANTGIIRMIDNQDCVVEIEDSAFQGCVNLLGIKANACVILGESVFESAGNGFSVSMPAVTTMGVRCFYEAQITNTSFPQLTNVPDYAFYNSGIYGGVWDSVLTVGDFSFYLTLNMNTGGMVSMPLATVFGSNSFALSGMDEYNFPLLQHIGTSSIADTSIPDIILPELLTVGDFGLANNANAISVSLPKATTLGVEALAHLPICEDIDIPLVTASGHSTFRESVSLTFINMPLLADLGGTPLDNEVFTLIVGNTITINCPASLQTINAGSPDGDLVELAANNTATINYI